MFERFTERARRAIFFALREASGFHCPWIMTEHLLLGILREDPGVANQLSGDSEETIRKEMERAAPPNRERIPTAGDLPLSEETRQALMFATKEADALQHKNIDTPHLVLGLLRIEDCTGAKLLREYGMDYDRYRDTLRTSLAEEPMRSPPIDRAIERPAPWYEAPWVASAAESLVPSIRALENLLDSTAAHIQAYSNSYGDQRLKRKSWTRKEALGHLIDWAMAHQQWLAQALVESKLTVAGYPDEAAVAIQHYGEFSWRETVDLWVTLNWLLVHVLQRVPADKLEVPCRIGIAAPVPLAELVDGYVEHCKDITGQILARL